MKFGEVKTDWILVRRIVKRCIVMKYSTANMQ